MSATNDGQEAEILAAEIIRMTNTVPQKILNSSGANSTKQFKEFATKARSVAMLKTKNLAKLRAAYALISPYYN